MMVTTHILILTRTGLFCLPPVQAAYHLYLSQETAVAIHVLQMLHIMNTQK